MLRWKRLNQLVDQFLYAFSVFGVPLAGAILSIIALTTWDSQYAAVGGHPLEFRVFEQVGKAVTPGAASEILKSSGKSVTDLDTHLSERPYWFAFTAYRSADIADMQIEFPSRHAQQIECWDRESLRELGSADRKVRSGQMEYVKAGFVLAVPKSSLAQDVLCRGVFSGPAHISVLQWDATQLSNSNADHHYRSGILEGSLTMLAVFMLLAAVINREWLYVLFAAWLIANLRLAALSAGWDVQWLDHDIPASWVHPLRKLTIASYYILTYTLFVRLFSDDIKRIGYNWLVHVAQWMGIPLLVAAIALPYGNFLPFMWLVVAVGSVTLVFLLARILYLTRSAVANWYAVSIAITVVSGLSEVVSASLGVTTVIWASNSVTAAAASSLTTALAIATQMREERVERVQAETALSNTYNALPIGLFTLDMTGNFVGFNPALGEMLHLNGNSPTRLPGWRNYFDEKSWNRLRLIAAENGELEVHSLPDSAVPSRTFHVKASVSGGRIEGSMQDVTERASATQRLEYLAEYDPLTNVLNRRGVEKVLVTAAQELAGQHPLSIAYLDLDRFKLINDLYGHTTGDDVLREICRRITFELGANHHIGRVGGDEFVLIFINTPIAAATDICRGIIAAIEDEPCHVDEKAFQVKGSIGLIEVEDGTVIPEAISIADRACREAKHNPANLAVYERGARAFRERREELALIDRFGVERVPEGLFLEMQPIMSLTTPYDSLDFEVLLRLRERDNSITPAGKIIGAAENNGRISLIDRWVLSNTLRWLAENRHRLPRTRFVCVNLSGGSLNDERFIRDAFAMVAEAGEIASLLCFEITESVALHDLGNTSRFIDTVRSHGAKVALDDFGAGYTSFSYLKGLHAEAVKIDGAFVRDVNSHPANLAIVEAITDLSHNLGMKTIAEWAEDAATVSVLSDIGVDYVQGYAVARPMSPERILTADSCGALIEDPKVAALVWNELGKLVPSPDLDGIPGLSPRRRH